MQGSGRRLPDEHRVHPRRDANREGQVASPRGPAVVFDPPAWFVRDLLDCPALNVEHVGLALLVGERNPLRVGRPSQSIQPPPNALCQLAGHSPALIDDMDLLLPGPIRDEGDLAPVRGPTREPVVSVGRLREISRRPFLGRHGEDVAPRAEHRPAPLRAERIVLDVAVSRDAPRTPCDSVAGNLDRNAPRLPCRRIVHSQFAVQFIHDASVGVRSRPAHVPSLLPRDPLGFLGAGVVTIQIQHAIPVRNKVHIVPNPHGIAIRADVIRDLFRAVAVEVEEIQVLSPAALIALPRSKVAKQRRVGHSLAVWRNRSRSRFGNWQGAW